MNSNFTTRRVRVIKSGWIISLILIMLIIGAGVFLRSRLAMPHDQPVLLPPPPPIDASLIDTVLPRDSIQAIDAPQFESAAVATAGIDADEGVIGLVINGDTRAYPIPILSRHEIVNDVVGGESVAITWCPLCYSALVFSRRIEGQAHPLTFGVSGKLLYNVLVMYDRQTETLWSQLYGGGIDGPLVGAPLAVYPSLLTEWEMWRAQHPNTMVLSKRLTCEQFACGSYADNPRGSYDVDPYKSYYNMPDEGVVNRQIPRGEGARTSKERVLGVRVAGQARAYPFDALVNQPLINDTLNNVPILVWFDPTSQTGTAYIRRARELVLTFSADPTRPSILLDTETGSRWQAMSGVAIAGPLRGERLATIVATPAFEFGWYAYFPHSETYVSDEAP